MASDLLGVAVTGLKVSQTQLSVTGNNITHASDETYSRQRTEVGSNPGLYTGAGYISSGVNVQTVARLVDQFVTSQIRLDTTAYSELETFTGKINQLDSLLANESVGLSTGLNNYFSALQAASDDPTSIPVRQLVLAEANVLSDRFNNLYGRLNEINTTINRELKAVATQVNALAVNLAKLNESIADAVGKGGGHTPNDLLDQREETLRQLSELVSVTLVEQERGVVNVFVGNGQPLVIGGEVNNITAIPGQTDASRYDIVFTGNGGNQVITNELTGGQIGGLIDFRSDVLNRTFNELGRIATVFVDAMNEQQSVGLDLNGHLGQPLFDTINNRSAVLSRVAPSDLNAAPADRVMTVAITDPSALTNSDYELRLSGAGPSAYKLYRVNDNTVVQSGGLPAQRPTTIEVDGFEITLESGSFADSDFFLISPTRNAAANISVLTSAAESLAFAQPIVTSTSLANSGTGTISQGEVLAVINPVTGEPLSTFAVAGELSPPLLVKFTSATTYDLLDATDPANPVSLNPPLENLAFVPGQSNQIIPDFYGQTRVGSDGFNAGRIPRAAEIETGPVGIDVNNTILAERITITSTDSTTGLTSQQPQVLINEGDSAETIALKLSSRTGVSASAFTKAIIGVNDDGVAGVADFNLHLNGIDLTNVLADAYSPNAVPRPLTNDLIAEAINTSGVLADMGITAISDGNQVIITASTGSDLAFQVEGEAADNIIIKDASVATINSTQNLNNGYTFVSGDSFTIDAFNGPFGVSNPKVIAVEGTFTNLDDLTHYLQQKIDEAYGVTGKVDVSVTDDGYLSFASTDTSPLSKIQVSNLARPNLLGLAAAESAGEVIPAGMLTLTGTDVAGMVNATSISGTVSVTLEDSYSLTSSAAGRGNIFTAEPEALSTFWGYSFTIGGNPDAGDEFYVSFNAEGVSDNRNALKFIEIEASGLIKGTSSIKDAYGDLVEFIGTVTSESKVNRDAANEILEQSKALRNSLSGVNLDEEAANLIRFEQVYNASSRVISVARDLFDTLLGAF